ncbi:MAG: Ig-like domain-containing protein [Bacteroidales bacterium]|nr:Ig-like domain-containing protein [Bacteroidales bacterium]
MKNFLLLLLLGLSFPGIALSQGLIIYDIDENEITADTLWVYGDANAADIKAKIFLYNDSDRLMQILVRKIEKEILDGTDNTFCWFGACFPPHVYEATDAMLLESGEMSDENDFYGEYYPNGQQGITIVTYEFFSANEGFDTVQTTVVYNTESDTPDAPVISFNLENNAEDVALDFEFVITADQPIRHEDGSEITAGSVGSLINFRLGSSEGGNVPFEADINEEHTQISLKATQDLVHTTTYFLEFLSVMGVEGTLSDPVAIHFTTETTTDALWALTEGFLLSKPAPHPAADYTRFTYDLPLAATNATINIYALNGVLLLSMQLDPLGHSVMLDTSGLQNGVYLYALVIDGRRVSGNKLVVNR